MFTVKDVLDSKRSPIKATDLSAPEVLGKLPPLYFSETLSPENTLVPVKFFTPDTDWTWYAIEYDPETRTFFGLVDGFERELGYFNLDELESLRGPIGLSVERDLYWNESTTLSEIA